VRSGSGVFFVLFLTLGLGWNAFGDVNGDVTLQIGLIPEVSNAQTEAIQFAIDFEVLSNVNWTVSGLTLGSRMALGVTGIEHSILTAKTTLGALDIFSESVFATPFATNIPSDIDGDGIPNISDPDIDGDGLLDLVDPTPFGTFDAFIKPDIDGDGLLNEVDPDIDGDGIANAIDTTPFGTNFVITPVVRPIGPTLFVKKRITTTLNLAGFTLTNLAIFEDVNFTHPFASSVQTYGAELQTFQFGDIITVLGQTVSGINIRSVTGLGADPSLPNLVKKASFLGAVCKDPNNSIATPAARPFAFCVEQLFIDNVNIGSLVLNSRTEFRILPLKLGQTLTLRHGLFNDLINVTAAVNIDNVVMISPVNMSLFINSAPLTVFLGFNSKFAITSATSTLSVNVGSALLGTTAVFLPTTGLSSLSFRFQTVSPGGISVFANAVLSNPGAAPNGGFGNLNTAFSVNGQITPAFGINSSMGFTNTGFSNVTMRFVFKF